MEDIIPEVKPKRPIISFDKSLTTNLFLSGITTFSGFISGSVIIMVLGRLLPIAVFGEVVYAFTFATLAQLIPSYGFPLLVVVEIAQKRLSPPKAVVNILAAQTILSVITLVGLGIFAITSGQPPALYITLGIFVISGILNAFSTVISAVNKGLNDFTVEAKVAVVKTLTLCIFIFGALALMPQTSTTVGWGTLLSNVLGIAAAVWLVKPLLRKEPGILPDRETIRKMLQIGMPFAVQIIFATLYFQLDSLIVGNLLNMESVGYYQAATRIVIAVIPVAMIIVNAYYPRLARDYDPETSTFRSRDPQKMIGSLLLLGLAGMLFFMILAEPIISIVYGPKMFASVAVLRIFAVVLLFRFVAGGFGVLLIACGRQTVLLQAAVAATILNVVLNLVLVPQYGIESSAWANVITNMLILVIYLLAFYNRPRVWLSKLFRGK